MNPEKRGRPSGRIGLPDIPLHTLECGLPFPVNGAVIEFGGIEYPVCTPTLVNNRAVIVMHITKGTMTTTSRWNVTQDIRPIKNRPGLILFELNEISIFGLPPRRRSQCYRRNRIVVVGYEMIVQTDPPKPYTITREYLLFHRV